MNLLRSPLEDVADWLRVKVRTYHRVALYLRNDGQVFAADATRRHKAPPYTQFCGVYDRSAGALKMIDDLDYLRATLPRDDDHQTCERIPR